MINYQMQTFILTSPRQHSRIEHVAQVMEYPCIACATADCSHLPEWMRPHAVPLEGAASDPDPYHRIASMRNFARCLRGSETDVLLVECDTAVTRDFHAKLKTCIAECSAITERYALTLYHTAKLTETPIEHVDSARWNGAQAVYFPKLVVPSVSEAFDRELLRSPRRWRGNDFVISQWCIATWAPLFAANPSLVQHRGPSHSSPTFTL